MNTLQKKVGQLNELNNSSIFLVDLCFSYYLHMKLANCVLCAGSPIDANNTDNILFELFLIIHIICSYFII